MNRFLAAASLMVGILYTSGAIALSTGSGTVRAATPTITAVVPNTGPTTGGTTVTLLGSGFTAVYAVSFGGILVPAVVFNDATLVVTAPAHPAGAVDVIVINPEGTSSPTPADVYTYVGPSGPPVPSTADDCKKGGWQLLARADGSTFKNQGDCVSYTRNGK